MSNFWNQYVSKQKVKVERQALTGPKRANQLPQFWTQSAHIAGGLSTGDSQAQLVVPFDCKPVWASIALGDTGTTGSTTVVLGAVTAGGTDPSGGQLSIAAGADDVYWVAIDGTDVDGSNTNWSNVNMAMGTALHVNIDAVTTTPSADLTVTVGFITR